RPAQRYPRRRRRRSCASAHCRLRKCDAGWCIPQLSDRSVPARVRASKAAGAGSAKDTPQIVRFQLRTSARPRRRQRDRDAPRHRLAPRRPPLLQPRARRAPPGAHGPVRLLRGFVRRLSRGFLLRVRPRGRSDRLGRVRRLRRRQGAPPPVQAVRPRRPLHPRPEPGARDRGQRQPLRRHLRIPLGHHHQLQPPRRALLHPRLGPACPSLGRDLRQGHLHRRGRLRGPRADPRARRRRRRPRSADLRLGGSRGARRPGRLGRARAPARQRRARPFDRVLARRGGDHTRGVPADGIEQEDGYGVVRLRGRVRFNPHVRRLGVQPLLDAANGRAHPVLLEREGLLGRLCRWPLPSWIASWLWKQGRLELCFVPGSAGSGNRSCQKIHSCQNYRGRI
ncbi:hypothetical protein DFJ74DRAFT_774653, partial [Hyaloraphidium curvatum]